MALIRDSSFLANFASCWQPDCLLMESGSNIVRLTIAVGIGLAYAEEYGISPAAYTPGSPLIAIQGFVFTIIIFAVFIYLLISGLENAIKNAQAGTLDLEKANLELTIARSRLELNRNDLLLANEQLKRRAERISTIANISKTLTLVQDIEQLLPAVVGTISQRFGFYHTGIYLLDDPKAGCHSACKQ
jgi:hypothetical protein